MTNPVDDYIQGKEAAKDARKQKEIDLWRTWKDNGEKPHHLEPLLKLYEPNINSKIRQWKANSIPESAFRLVLQEHLVNAFKSYDPSRGAALNTHVENRLHKAKRYNIRNQNMAYIPEGQVGGIAPINRAVDHLTEELGRAPTNTEISDHLRELSSKYKDMSPKRVETIRSSQRRDIPGFDQFESDPVPRGTNYEEAQLEVAAGILPHLFPNKPEMHTLFNHVFGTNGHEKITSTTALAKKMGKTQQQIARAKTQMGNVLREKMGLTGIDEE